MRRTALGLVLAAALSGCGPADSENRGGDGRVASPRVVSISPAKVTTRIVGATPEQKAVLLEILAGIGATPIPQVEVEQNPEPGWGAAPDAVGFRADISEHNAVGAWHAELIGLAFAERSEQLDLQPVVYLADRESVRTTDVWRAKSDLSRERALAVAEQVWREADQAGAKVRRLELVKPYRYAFRLELQVDDPAGFLRNDYETVLEPFDGSRVERYLEIRDAQGHRVLVSGAWFSIREDVESCAPILVSRPVSAPPPPPCPAD